jgi:hypothetical protein
MKQDSSVSLGPWARGIQNVNDPAACPSGSVLEANNVLITSDGSIVPRAGYSLVSTGGHSLFTHAGRVFGIYNKRVCEFHDSGATVLSSFDIEGKVTWSLLNEEPVFTNHSILARLTSDGVKKIGVELPVVPSLGTQELTEDSTAVAFVNFDGEEGPLSPVFVGNTIAPPSENTVARMRIYKPRSDVLYMVKEITVSTTVPDIRTDLFGKPADTLNKARMPGGDYVRYWRGRLLVARGRTLFFSDPMRYGMYDRSSGFVTFESRIDFIEPVEGGVFVALRDSGVHFLAGEMPEKWERKIADIIPAQAGSSLLVPTAQMKLELQSKPEWVAVWLTHKGFALGLPSGNILYPQADLLSGLPLGTGSLSFEGDRLIALSQ